MKIGVIGAGQLGRMLALAGYPLALQFRFLDASADSPGGQVAPIVTGAFDDPQSLERLAADVDLVTYEFENVPVAALQKVAQTHAVWPPVEALRVSQDRLLEKQLFEKLKIPTPPFRAIDSLADLEAAVRDRRAAVRAEDAPARLRRQGPALPAQARRRRAGLGCARRRAVDPRRLRRLRARSVDRRRTQHDGRSPLLPDRREHAPRRHPARDAGAAAVIRPCRRPPRRT